MNSRSKHIGEILIIKTPTKKFLSLQGKTAYDKYTNKFNQSVWKKDISNNKNSKCITYSLFKCNKVDNEGNKCSGYLVYDEHEYKICNVCGLGLKDNNITNYKRYNSSAYQKTNGYKDESIKMRNHLWDDFMLDKIIYKGDKGAEEIIKRYENIRKYEQMRNKK